MSASKNFIMTSSPTIVSNYLSRCKHQDIAKSLWMRPLHQGIAVITVVSLLVYANTLFGGLVFDDQEAIVNNRDVRENTPLASVFSNDFWGSPLTHPESHKSYRPLTILTFRFNRNLHELSPWGYHLFNVLAHTAVCVLFTCFSCSLLASPSTGLLAGLLFTLHPIHTEAVANVVGRAEMLCAIWYLVAILVFMRLTKIKNAGLLFWFHCALVVLCSILSLLCKEQGVTVLGVCAAYDICTKFSYKSIVQAVSARKLKRSQSLQLLRIFVLTVSTIIILYVRVITIGQGSPKFVESDNPASFSNFTQTKLFTYSYVNAYNVWLLLNPYPLCHDWSMGSIPLVETISDVRNLVTLSVIIAITILIIYGAITNKSLSASDKPVDVTLTANTAEESDDIHSRTKTNVLFSLLMALLPFVPASNLLFPVGFVVAERILYLPSMGYCLLVAIGFNAFKTTRRSPISMWRFDLTVPAASLVYFVLIVFAAKTVVRNTEWWDTEYLAEAGMKTNPLNAKMFMTMGNVLAQKGQRKCEVYYREAIRVRPHYVAAWNNLGLVLLNMDRPKEAEECYLKALSLKPDHVDTNMNAGHMYRIQERWKEAKEKYETVLKRRPSFFNIRHHLGFVNEQLKLYKAAEYEYEKALESHASHADTHFALARLLTSTDGDRQKPDLPMISKKRLKKAQDHYEIGLRYKPEDGQARSDLINLLIYMMKLSEAERHLAFQARLDPIDAASGIYKLGKIYKENGNTKRGIALFKEALKLNPSLTAAADQIKELTNN